MGKHRIRRSNSGEQASLSVNSTAVWIVAVLLIMYILTGLLLLILAAVIYNLNLSQQTIQIALILIYVITGLAGGILMGKRMRERRYLWGLVAGIAYFFILMIISFMVNGGQIGDGIRVLVTGVLCIASAMIGGMLS